MKADWGGYHPYPQGADIFLPRWQIRGILASFYLSMDMTNITHQSQLSYIFNTELQAVTTNQSELSGEKKPVHHLCSNRRTDKVVWEEEAGFRVR